MTLHSHARRARDGLPDDQEARRENQGAGQRALARAIIGLKGRFKTITLDNGTEFHDYKSVEGQLGEKFCFAKPHHSWKRRTNENTIGFFGSTCPRACA